VQPFTIKISKIIDENTSIKTFYFDYNLKSQPGQFVMLWIPDVDQKPFSISFDDGKTFGLTVFKRGPLTEKLFELNLGDRVGITGPFGTSYSIKPDYHYYMVAGGYGAAPLGNLAERINGAKIDFIVGARSHDLLLFEDRLKKIPNLNLHITTDDGSAGTKGRVTDVLEKLLENQNDDKRILVTCGPELMQTAVLALANKYDTKCEVSVERHMKCGFGVCGQCVVDDLGICTCMDGPVMSRTIANQIFELGKYHRDKTGNIIKF